MDVRPAGSIWLSRLTFLDRWLGREHRDIDQAGQITFNYDRQTLEKTARIALFSFADGVKHFVGYFEANVEEIVNSTISP